MNITIVYSEVLFDLQNKNREEVRSIQEPQARYQAEAGSNKTDEVRRCLQEAFSQVESMYVRFINSSSDNDASNVLEEGDDRSLVFEVSDRRASGKSQVIADTIHSLIVNHALQKFYNTVQQPELAAKRNSLAEADASMLNKLLYEKLPPIYPSEL